MQATEIIRSILDLIDHIEIEQQPEQDPCAVTTITSINDVDPLQQMVDLLGKEYGQMYDNSPNEVVSGIDAVTTNAGGGWNGPKHPADIRADSVSMYPNHLHNPR